MTIAAGREVPEQYAVVTLPLCSCAAQGMRKLEPT